MGPAQRRKWVRSSPCTPKIPHGCQFYPGSPASLPAPCLWPRKAVEDDGPRLWDPAPAWETWKRLLALDRHRIGRCAHLGSESLDGRSSSLPLSFSSLYIRLSNEKIIKNKSLKNKIPLKKKEWDFVKPNATAQL